MTRAPDEDGVLCLAEARRHRLYDLAVLLDRHFVGLSSTVTCTGLVVMSASTVRSFLPK